MYFDCSVIANRSSKALWSKNLLSPTNGSCNIHITD